MARPPDLRQRADTLAEAMAVLERGLAKWVKCEQWQDLKYVPYPGTFLHQRRWENPPAEGGWYDYDLDRFAKKQP